MQEFCCVADKSIYPREAVLKAAYRFIEDYFVYIDADNEYYKVHLTAKPQVPPLPDPGREFLNELLAQTVHLEVYQRTHAVREILLARALATTIVVSNDPALDAGGSEDDFIADDILQDWFEANE